MRRLCVCLLPLLEAVAWTALAMGGESDDWPRYAHDRALTARSPLHGNIAKPQTRWSYSAAGRELLIDMVSAQGKHALRFRASEPVAVTFEPKVAAPRPLELDLDGSGTLRPAAE